MKKKNDLYGSRLKIGGNIRKWRNIKEVKQKDLAAALQLSEAAVSNIENNITDVTLSQLEDISSTLDIPLEQLFCDPQESFASTNGSAVPASAQSTSLIDKEMFNAILASMQKKDEQLQLIMQNVLHTMSSLMQDDRRFA